MSSISASLVLAWAVSAAPADIPMTATPVPQLTLPPPIAVAAAGPRFAGRGPGTRPVVLRAGGGGRAGDAPPPQLDAVMLLGFLSALLALLCLAYERTSRAFGFGLALACALTAVYAVLAGAWPLSALQCVWSIAAFRRWRASAPRTRRVPPLPRRRPRAGAGQRWVCESRMSRMFGPP